MLKNALKKTSSHMALTINPLHQAGRVGESEPSLQLSLLRVTDTINYIIYVNMPYIEQRDLVNREMLDVGAVVRPCRERQWMV